MKRLLAFLFRSMNCLRNITLDTQKYSTGSSARADKNCLAIRVTNQSASPLEINGGIVLQFGESWSESGFVHGDFLVGTVQLRSTDNTPLNAVVERQVAI